MPARPRSHYRRGSCCGRGCATRSQPATKSCSTSSLSSAASCGTASSWSATRTASAGCCRTIADNYVRFGQNRRIFHFDCGSGMLSAEGEELVAPPPHAEPGARPSRRPSSPAPMLCDLADPARGSVHQLSARPGIDVADMAAVWMTLSAGHVFAGEDRALDPMLLRMGVYPGRYSLLDLLPFPRPAVIDRSLPPSPGRSEPILPRCSTACSPSGAAPIGRRQGPAVAPRQQPRPQHRRAAEPWRIARRGADPRRRRATPLRALTWIWYLLALFPDAEERLHAELDDVLGGPFADPTTFRASTYLRRCRGRDDAPLSAFAGHAPHRPRTTMSMRPAYPAAIRLSRSCRGWCTVIANCGTTPTASIRTASARTGSRRARAMPTSRSASGRMSASPPAGDGRNPDRDRRPGAAAPLPPGARSRRSSRRRGSTLRPRHDIRMTVEPRSPDAVARRHAG